jgi:hypothetical protein
MKCSCGKEIDLGDDTLFESMDGCNELGEDYFLWNYDCECGKKAKGYDYGHYDSDYDKEIIEEIFEELNQ